MSDLGEGPSSDQLQIAAGGNGPRAGSGMPAGGDQGTASAIGKVMDLNHLSGNINDFGLAGADTTLSFLGGGISNENILAFVDGPFVSPGNINAFQGMGEFSAVGNMTIGEATGVTKVTGLDLAGKTSIGSPSQGAGH